MLLFLRITYHAQPYFGKSHEQVRAPRDPNHTQSSSG